MHMFRMNTTLLAATLLLFGAGACGPAPDDAPDAGTDGEGDALVIEPTADTGADTGANPGGDMATEAPVSVDEPQLPVIGETVTTESGLQYEEVVVGTGAEATAGSQVAVNYSGFLEDGTMFDSSIGGEPFGFALGTGAVIAGWDEGVAGMLEGGRRTLIIPAELGYGAAGAGNAIPGGATLIFDVELLQVLQ